MAANEKNKDYIPPGLIQELQRNRIILIDS